MQHDLIILITMITLSGDFYLGFLSVWYFLNVITLSSYYFIIVYLLFCKLITKESFSLEMLTIKTNILKHRNLKDGKNTVKPEQTTTSE